MFATHSFAGRGQVLLDKGQSDGNESLQEDPLPHCAAVIVVLLRIAKGQSIYISFVLGLVFYNYVAQL